MAQVNFAIQNFGETESILQKILDILFETHATDVRLYSHYLNFLTFYLYTNLDKAIMIAKALCTQQERAKIPLNIQSDILFLLGV
jgi:hypothetical protein